MSSSLEPNNFSGTAASESSEQPASDYRIPCRKCLLAGIREEDVQNRLRDYILAIEPSERCDSAVYEQRLTICEACASLSGGMCRECGCFVIYRAAFSEKHCPYFPSGW